ncbi:MAG: hypothetical protein N2446_03560, partial [Elusimicrobiales bacterium]|nr:hypothetical protein [Elusimicrobiales bacterium]
MNKIYSFVSYSNDYELINSDISNSSSFSAGGDFSNNGCLGQNFANDSVKKIGDYSLRVGFYNPPHFQFQRSVDSFYKWNDERKVRFPANSVSLERFDILWQEIDINSVPEIVEATRKLSKIKGIEIFPTELFNFAFFDEEKIEIKTSKKGIVSVKVNDMNSDGYIDATNSKIKFKTLSGYLYDDDYKIWAKTFSSRVNYFQTHAIVEFEVLSGGVFGVMGDIDLSVKDTYAFPVPFRPNGPKSGVCSGCSGSDEEGIVFYNVPQKGYIEIYTVDGRLVRKINIDENTIINEVGGVAKIKWDTKNESGEKLVSGVYIWRVVSENYITGFKNTKTG